LIATASDEGIEPSEELGELVIVETCDVDGIASSARWLSRWRPAVAAREQDVAAADHDIGIVEVGPHDVDEVGDALGAILA
jgi:hypothetical protein